jgi:hypothetical protein
MSFPFIAFFSEFPNIDALIVIYFKEFLDFFDSFNNSFEAIHKCY